MRVVARFEVLEPRVVGAICVPHAVFLHAVHDVHVVAVFVHRQCRFQRFNPLTGGLASASSAIRSTQAGLSARGGLKMAEPANASLPSCLVCEQSPRDAARIPLSAKQNEHGRRDKIGCVEEAKTVIGVPHGERAAAFELPVR